jgi:phage regulator Rha-like protein
MGTGRVVPQFRQALITKWNELSRQIVLEWK